MEVCNEVIWVGVAVTINNTYYLSAVHEKAFRVHMPILSARHAALSILLFIC
jgi:hypothetical protein